MNNLEFSDAEYVADNVLDFSYLDIVADTDAELNIALVMPLLMTIIGATSVKAYTPSVTAYTPQPVMRLSGDVYVYPIVDGVEETGIGPLPAKFSYTPAARVDVLDNRKGRRGCTIASVTSSKALEAELEVITVPRAMLAMFAQSAIIHFVEQSVTIQPTEYRYTVDRWTKVAHLNLANVVIRSDAGGGGTLYINGTDYNLNVAVGMFRPIVGGAMNGGSCYVSYEAAASSGNRIDISSACNTLARIEIDGRNETCTNTPIICRVESVRLRPKDSFTFDDDKPKTLKFDVKIQCNPPLVIEFPVYE